MTFFPGIPEAPPLWLRARVTRSILFVKDSCEKHPWRGMRDKKKVGWRTGWYRHMKTSSTHLSMVISNHAWWDKMKQLLKRLLSWLMSVQLSTKLSSLPMPECNPVCGWCRGELASSAVLLLLFHWLVFVAYAGVVIEDGTLEVWIPGGTSISPESSSSRGCGFLTK